MFRYTSTIFSSVTTPRFSRGLPDINLVERVPVASVKESVGLCDQFSDHRICTA